MDAQWDLMKPFVPMIGKEGHLYVAAVLMLTGLPFAFVFQGEARSWLIFLHRILSYGVILYKYGFAIDGTRATAANNL